MKIENINLRKIKGKRLLFVDGNNLCHRCWHGAKNADQWSQKQIATLLALKQLLDFKMLCLNSILVIFWDSQHSYRANIYDFYKQHKKDKDGGLEIIDNIKKLISDLGIQSFEQWGYEGDDLIAAYSNFYSKTNKVIIYSTDNDLFQCLKHRVLHWNPIKNELNTYNTIKEKMGLNPKDIALKKAMVGKKNEIPGIPKIGEKTSLKIINGEIDFPEFDMDIFKDYLDASIIPFEYDPGVEIKEIEKYNNKISVFKTIFQENNLNNFLTQRSINIWSKHFNLK